MAKVKGLGSSLSYLPAYDSGNSVITVGALTSIGEIAPGSEEIDVTTLDSSGGFREFLQGFKDSGELALTGYHDKANTGQATMRTLYGTGATGYFWVTFPDATAVIFTAYVKSYKAGAAEVDGAVGFGATLRITGIVQIIATKAPVAKAVTAGSISGSMDSTAMAYTGSPAYQWYSNTSNANTGGSVVAGQTGATMNIPADLTAGTHYYYCVVTVTGYRAVPSEVHVVTVAEA
jgi:predicted secreted protein